MKKSLAVVTLAAAVLLIVQFALADPGDLPYKVYIPIVEAPPCADPLVGGELYATASASIVHVGEIVTVTGTIYNNGCGHVGQPSMGTNVWDTAILSSTQSMIFQCLNADVLPGHYCAVQFEFLANDSGLVTVLVGAHYEAQGALLGSALSNPIPIRVIP